MRAIFSVVSLLVVAAVVGLLVMKQLKSAAPLGAAEVPGASASAPTLSGTPVQQSQQIQERVRNDVAQALEQAAAARKEEADK